ILFARRVPPPGSGPTPPRNLLARGAGTLGGGALGPGLGGLGGLGGGRLLRRRLLGRGLLGRRLLADFRQGPGVSFLGGHRWSPGLSQGEPVKLIRKTGQSVCRVSDRPRPRAVTM